MPDDSPDVPGAQHRPEPGAYGIPQALPSDQDQAPGDVEVTCSGGITIPTVGAGDGE